MDAPFFKAVRRRSSTLVLCALLLAAAGCAHSPFRSKSESEAAAIKGSATMASLQNEVMRFADSYVTSVARAADTAAAKAGTREAKVAALNWKLSQANAAYVDATGQIPTLNALDLVILATVSRMLVETGAAPWGAAAQILVDTHRELEASAWPLAREFLSNDEVEELKTLILEWRRRYPDERNVSAARFRDFALTLGKASDPTNVKPTSIFSLLYINPFAGLSPTTVAIEQTRELAERTVAYAERAPTLLRWQIELLTYDLADHPGSQQLLADATRASRAMESVSKTAEGLPKLVDEEREKAIAQFWAGVASERQQILQTMAAHETEFRGLLGQTRQTLDAGSQMATSVNTAVLSLDTFLRHQSAPSGPPSPCPAEPSKPFNVLDYGTAATQVGGMAKDINSLLASVDQSVPKLSRVTQQAGEDLKGVVDHAFWRGLVLIITLLVGSVPAALAYRALARRLGLQSGRAASPPASGA